MLKVLIIAAIALQMTAVVASAPKKIQISPIILWQGNEILQHNISSIDSIRKSMGFAPLYHFISPRYFITQDREQQPVLAASILTSIKAGDAVGLYYDPSICRHFNCGRNINSDEARVLKILDISNGIFKKNGITVSKLIYLENQFFEPNLLNKFKSHGYLKIFGPVFPDLFTKRKVFQNLANVSQTAAYFAKKQTSHIDLKPDVREKQDQQKIQVKPSSTILTDAQINPINGGIIDINTDEMIFETLKKQWENLDLQDNALTANIILHQETAHHFLPRVRRLLDRVYNYANEQRILVTYRP